MSETPSRLPKELTTPTTNDPLTEQFEDIRRLLEEVIEQNATILERLDDWDEDEVEQTITTVAQKPVFVQLFDRVFSWETVFAIFIVLLLIVPLARLAFK